MKDIVEDMISSYETGIQRTATIFDTTQQILTGFQDSLLDTLDTKEEREGVRSQLRESLARNRSLRRKDFDNMMQGTLSIQDEREKEVRSLLKGYLNDQKGMAQGLREGLRKFQDSLTKGETQRVKEFECMIKGILAKQDERKREVTSKLKDFQKEQQEMTKKLKELLDRGSKLRARDLKSMLEEFRSRHEERMTRQKERKEEVQGMLNDFRKEREEAGKEWRSMQKKVAQRKIDSKKVISLKILVEKEKEV